MIRKYLVIIIYTLNQRTPDILYCSKALSAGRFHTGINVIFEECC